MTTVLFDLDGTLVDSFILITSAFRHACRTVLGQEPSDDDVTARWGQPLSARFAAVEPARVPELLAAYTAHYTDHHDRLAAPFPGVMAMLARLSERGLRLGVVTSKRRGPTDQALASFGLSRFFRLAVTVEDVASPKPAPEGILEAARRLHVAAAEVWMVGDGVLDIQAARAAGVRSVAALWGTREREAVLASRPDYVAERPDVVVALVSE